VLDQLNAQFMFKVGILFAAVFDKKCRCFWKKKVLASKETVGPGW